jgi:pyruvate ferredoxin oxidoreductase delta subunit
LKAKTSGRTAYPGPHWKAGDIPIKVGNWSNTKPVFTEKCNYCLLCWVLCPDGAIIRNDDETLAVNKDLCKACGICAHECPMKAIEMKPV